MWVLENIVLRKKNKFFISRTFGASCLRVELIIYELFTRVQKGEHSCEN